MIEVDNARILHFGVFPGGLLFSIRRERFNPNCRGRGFLCGICYKTNVRERSDSEAETRRMMHSAFLGVSHRCPMPPLPLFSFLGSFLPRETDDRMWGMPSGRDLDWTF
jgi:hypothetical protein